MNIFDKAKQRMVTEQPVAYLVPESEMESVRQSITTKATSKPLIESLRLVASLPEFADGIHIVLEEMK